MVGLLCSIFIFFNRYWLLKILYDTSLGADYLKILCPFFILFYLEAPLSSVLIALDKIKISTFISVSGSIIKIIIMTLCLIFNMGIYSLIVSEIINLIYVILFNIYIIKKSSIFTSEEGTISSICSLYRFKFKKKSRILCLLQNS